MDRCPNCRARLAEQPVCPRCGCDYSLAQQAEAAAQRRLLHAWHLMNREESEGTHPPSLAYPHLLRAQELKQSPIGRFLMQQHDPRYFSGSEEAHATRSPIPYS